jgi:hypothetical protein
MEGADMNQHQALIAYLSTVAAIVVLVMAGAYMAVNGRNAEALGIGGAVTGLIGVLGTFKPKTNTETAP